MLQTAVIISCAICVGAGLYVGIMIFHEFPRLRNKL